MKKIKCRVRFHGSFKEHLSQEFESIAAAKKYVSECWDGPYTIVRLTK